MTRRKTRGVRACTHQYSTGASAKRCVQARTLPQASRGTRARRGLVLVLVMVVIVMLSLAGLSFVALMSTENKAVYLRGDELQAECLLGSAEAAIQAMLELPPEKRQADGGLVDNADRFKGVLVLGDQRSKRRGRYAVFSPRVEDGRTTGIRFGLQNESARLNLTVLPDWERRKPGSARAALLKLPGMTEPIADATLDWIDADTTPRQSGAEADYYTSLAVPYAPRNAVPGCLEELLLVKGVTRELVFGADANFNGRIDPGESAGGNTAESVTGPPWASLVTLYSAESNLNPQGKPRVYLNQGDLRTLHGQLVKVLDADQAKFIILYRQFGPSNKEPPEQPKAGETLSSVQVNFGEQGTRRLASVLSLIGARVEVPGQGVKKAIVLRSPFSEETTAMSTYLPRLLDHTSVVRGRVIRGRVNVDLASARSARGHSRNQSRSRWDRSYRRARIARLQPAAVRADMPPGC